MKLNDWVRFRAPHSLVQRLKRIAEKTRRKLPDLYRIALEDYADANEKQLGIPPWKETKKAKSASKQPKKLEMAANRNTSFK